MSFVHMTEETAKPSKGKRLATVGIVLVAVVLVAGVMVTNHVVQPRPQATHLNVVRFPPSDEAKTALGKLKSCEVKYVVLDVTGARKTVPVASPPSSTCGMTIDEVANMCEADYPSSVVLVATFLKCNAQSTQKTKVLFIWDSSGTTSSQFRVDSLREVATEISKDLFKAEIRPQVRDKDSLVFTMNRALKCYKPNPQPTPKPITISNSPASVELRQTRGGRSCEAVCRGHGFPVRSAPTVYLCAGRTRRVEVTGSQRVGQTTCRVNLGTAGSDEVTDFSCFCSRTLQGFAYGSSANEDCVAKCGEYNRRPVETGQLRGTAVYACVARAGGSTVGGVNLAGESKCIVPDTRDVAEQVQNFGCVCL